MAITYLLPGLPGAVSAALRALMWAIALVAALALCVAVLVAVAPYLPTLLVGVAVTLAYAVVTYPRKAVRA